MSQYGVRADVADITERVARKTHNCHACGEAIAPGHRYTRVFYVYDGDTYTHKRCGRCEVIYRHLTARILSEGEHAAFCDDRLNCGHDYEERWDEPPPEWLAALAFWRPGDPLPTGGVIRTRQRTAPLK